MAHLREQPVQPQREMLILRLLPEQSRVLWESPALRERGGAWERMEALMDAALEQGRAVLDAARARAFGEQMPHRMRRVSMAQHSDPTSADVGLAQRERVYSSQAWVWLGRRNAARAGRIESILDLCSIGVTIAIRINHHRIRVPHPHFIPIR